MKLGCAVSALFVILIAHAADVPSQSFSRFAGRVLNAKTGEPLKKAQVILRGTVSSGLSYHAATDDQGSFALPAVAGGNYELVVQRPGFVQAAKSVVLTGGDTVEDAVVRLIPHGVVAGRVTDRDGDPMPRVTVEAIQAHYQAGGRLYLVAGTAITNDLGEYRIFGLAPGTYSLGGVYHGEAGDAMGYYPGALQASQAVPIRIPAGNEVHGLDFTLSDLHTVKLRGVVQAPPGLPLRGVTITAAPCDSGPLGRVTTSVRNSDGAFELVGVGPGCHILAADSFNAGKRYSARMTLNIGDAKIELLQVSLLPPIRLSGRLRTESGALPNTGPIFVNLESRSSEVTATGSPAEDGTLSIDNVVPETYEVSAMLPDGYYLKSARFGSIDVLQTGLDLGRGDPSRLDLEVSGDGGRIDGAVLEGDDQPTPGARVVLVPEDERSRRLHFQTAIADSKGAYRFAGIAPGDYRVYAFQTVDAGTIQDPAYLKRFEDRGKLMSIREHSHEVLRLAPIPAEDLR